MTLDGSTRDLQHLAATPLVAPVASDTVRASQDLLDAVFGNSDEAAVIVDDGGMIKYVTPGTADLLGYDRSAAVGRSVFEFLHPDDVAKAAEIFVRRLQFHGADQGAELRIQHASAAVITTVATAALLPDGAAGLGLGTCAIRLRAVGDGDAERELSLQRRIVVSQYANALGADLLAAAGSNDVLARVEAALGEIALLSGADTVLVCLERLNGVGVEVLATNHHADPITICAGPDDIGSLLSTHLCVDDLTQRRTDLSRAFGVEVHALLSTPFTSGSRRGALILLRMQPGPVWWDTDSELARGAANVISRALHTAWSEELLSLTYRSGPIAFSIHSWTGELVDCNDRYLELFGLDRTEVRDAARLRHVPEPARTELVDLVTKLRSGDIDRLDLEMEIARGDGELIWVRTNGVRLGMPGSADSVILTSYSDITSRHRQRLELEYAANHDPLTGVANRTSLWQTIVGMQDDDGQLPMLLIIDLDRFKHVNDTHGHHVGDLVLQAVVRQMQANVRSQDVIARLGGDEFAIALRDTTLADAERTAERLRRASEEPIEVDGRVIMQTLSIGVAAGSDCDNLAELMVRADRALYAAKHRGRNCQVVFHTTMNDEALADVQLERELQNAIANHELDVYFQPEFAVDDLTIVGAEALVRWHHPALGLVPAASFISIAERTGLIDEIGRFALREATRTFTAACDSLGCDDLTLRINISAREFARPELSDIVRSAVDRSGLDPSRLCLEMTETTLMDAPEIALATFATLHDIGVRFAIDDFGTGYSSLAYLKRFPVDVLKIDRTFIHDIDHDDESRAIVASILGLAKTLGLEVVAEGVERPEQLDALAELGCHRAQGFLVAPALPASEFILAIQLSGARCLQPVHR